MSKRKYFAIGSFNFGVQKKPPFKFSGSEYISELEKQLSNIPNLTELIIQTDDEFPTYNEQITKKTVNIQKDKGSFPGALILDISFNLHIPFKKQAKLKGVKKRRLRTYTEDFNIKISSNFYVPVAIIESLNPTENTDPSTAVQLVREYLKKEFKKSKHEYIRFEYLGPSPFHLDCFLIPKKDDERDWFFETDEFIQKGYNKLTVYYNKKEFQNADEAMEFFSESIVDEFGFYYAYQQGRVSKMREWHKIQKNVHKLLKIEKSKGIVGVYKKFFQRQGLIGKLFIGLATFEGQSIFDNNFYHNNYSQTFLIDEDVYFKKFIDKEMEENQDYPIKQTTELLNFLESRRVKSVELTMAIIAAIVGGAIGSLITIYFQ
ncbi:hypothetical protein V1T75_00590 [Tenacibaculum sp. FZY0031]|uniref:hypothetical protein n=1 Tax=Tenacibaculum sp. FZY0031 TaxID=3116648 RepID=UPI002EA96D05|nr:hypothetical protein [Tenacibaculum sp. FZY0031]